jgi:hypothetical protein
VNFGEVLERIAKRLEAEKVPFALIGGLGLAAFGIPRATVDLDLLVPRAAQDAVIALMEGLGYQTLHRSSGYSNHLHADPLLGRVDFVYVGGETRERIFAAARPAEGPGGLRVMVPRVEHLIAMKVLAMKNDPGRRHQELADIGALLRATDVDRDEVRGYFAQLGMLGSWDELAVDDGPDPPGA